MLRFRGNAIFHGNSAKSALRGPPPQNIQNPNKSQGILGVELWEMAEMVEEHENV